MKQIIKALPLLGLLIGAACSGGNAQDVPAEVRATDAPLVLGARDVAVVTAGESSTGIRITGSLDPARQVEVKAQVSGQLQRVNVDRGDAVRQGQLLAVIDSATQQAQSAAARAQPAAAERDFDAAEMLFKAGAISERDYVNARSARDAARAQVNQIGQSISQATIEAPQSGVVTSRDVSVGETVMPGATLFSIADVTRLELEGTIPADRVGFVRVGQPVALTLEAYPGRVITGRVDRIDPVADASTRQVTVYVVVDNSNRELVGGLFATGVIETDQPAAVATLDVPQSAVVDGNVFEVSTGRIRRIPLASVVPGQKVIVSPSFDLKEGRAIEVSQ